MESHGADAGLCQEDPHCSLSRPSQGELLGQCALHSGTQLEGISLCCWGVGPPGVGIEATLFPASTQEQGNPIFCVSQGLGGLPSDDQKPLSWGPNCPVPETLLPAM